MSTCPLTLDETTILLSATWLLQFLDLVGGQKTLVKGGKSSSLKEKEIVAGTGSLETSLHNVLRLLNVIFI